MPESLKQAAKNNETLAFGGALKLSRPTSDSRRSGFYNARNNRTASPEGVPTTIHSFF